MNNNNLLSRRRVITAALGGMGAAALGTASRFAIAEPTKDGKGSIAKELAAAEAANPPGSDTPETPLSTHGAKLGQALLHKSRHAFALAMANPTAKFTPGSIHASAASAFGQFSAKRQQRAKTRATSSLSAGDKSTSFGAYANADLASATVATKSTDIELSKVVRETTMALKDGQKQAEKDQKDGKDKDKDQPKYTRLMYQLNSVKCIQKQDSSAHDEVLISGYVIDRDGTLTKIDRIKYEGFSSGTKKYLDYEPCANLPKEYAELMQTYYGMCNHGAADDIYRGRKLVETKIGGPGTWGFVLVLGEQDDGGFSGWMGDIYKKLKSEIDTLVEGVLHGVGDAVGAALSSYIGPLGYAIGEALGWALGKLYEWVASLIGDPSDDILGAISWSITLQQRAQSWVKNYVGSGALASPKGTCASSMKKSPFKSQGGHYEVRWHWRAYET
jgi:hypothetical protein